MNIKIQKYLSEEMDKLKKIITDNKGQYILLDSETNTGKTYFTAELFKQEEFRDSINLLLTPAYIQNLQNECYGLKPIVSGKGLLLRNDVFSNNYSVVFEKVGEVLSDLKRIVPDKRVNIFCDEAHLLCTHSVFRNTSIKSILDIMNYSIKTNGSVVLMSGTCDSIKDCFTFGEIINTEIIKRNCPKNILLEINNTNKSVKDFTKYILLQYDKAIIRINDKKLIKLLAEDIVKYNKKCAFLSSDEKEFKVMQRERVFKNSVYGDIVEKKKIDKDIDYVFCTQILDQGISIEDSDIQNTIFVVNDKNNMSFENIIQFSNRLRYPTKNFIICMNNANNELPKLKTKEQIERECFQESINLLSDMKALYIHFAKMYKNNDKEIKNSMNQILKIKKEDDTNLNKNYIYYDETKEDMDRVYINPLCYQLYVVKKYQEQYYQRPEELSKILSAKFKKEVKINYNDIVIVKAIDTTLLKEEKKKDKQEVIKALKTLSKKTSHKLYDCLEPDAKIPDKLKPIFENKKYKNYLIRAKDLEINSNRVLELLSNEDTKIKDITDFFYRESIKKFNQYAVYEFAHYDNPTYSYIPFPEQRIVLQTLYKLNDNKTSLKKTILTDEILLDIKHKLNDSKQCSTLYNKPKTLELIGKIFYLEFKNNKTRIDSIKL